MSPGTVRPARPEDLPRLHELCYEGLTVDEESPPPIGPVPSILRHELESGTMRVAEVDGRIVGFAAVIVRGDVAHLSECRVEPEYEHRGIAHLLLHSGMPDQVRTATTFSTGELGALGLFVMAGMRPRWPALWVRAAAGEFERVGGTDVAADVAKVGDRELARWDHDIAGIDRPQDAIYWARERQAVPLWIRRGSTRLGYAWVQHRSDDSVFYPESLTIGPVGTRFPEHAAACVAAAVDWAANAQRMVRLMVPGPHPALPRLLAAGLRITYVETFLSSSDAPFFDPRCYVPSGSELL